MAQEIFSTRRKTKNDIYCNIKFFLIDFLNYFVSQTVRRGMFESSKFEKDSLHRILGYFDKRIKWEEVNKIGICNKGI